MGIDRKNVEGMLISYLTGELKVEDRVILDKWRIESSENEAMYQEYLQSWETIPLLKEMEQFNSFEALQKVNSRIQRNKSRMFWSYLQRVAAILLLPLLAYSGYLTTRDFVKSQKSGTIMQTISSHQGIVSAFSLADGTKVWLNSGSKLQFPTTFTGKRREVKLVGEAYFEVKKDANHPFRVNVKNLHIDDIGTAFDVVGYDDENQTKVVLVEGEVKLSQEKNDRKADIYMKPGQLAICREPTSKIQVQNVDVDKYIAWRDGNLMFREDNMEEVAKRLSRWFNIDIIVNDPEIKKYVYRATFRNESLTQVLDLLKISAPIDYRIIDSKSLPNGEHTRQKVYIMKRKK